MADDFENHAMGLTSPVTAGEAITPSDTVELNWTTRVLYVGSSGDVNVKLPTGDTVTLLSAQAGAMYPIRVVQVFASGTTASIIVGLR